MSVLLLLASGALATVMVFRAADENVGYWASVAGSVPLLLGAGLLAWQADRYRRSGAESLRIQRQLMTLEDYLAPFQEPTRSLIRASLAPRFFGRIIDDLDPLRDVRMPEASDLLGTLQHTPTGSEADHHHSCPSPLPD